MSASISNDIRKTATGKPRRSHSRFFNPPRRGTKAAQGSPARRGVALILVLTTLAILTSLGVDFSYSTRVNLKLAENLRDELRAYYMARSAINLTRMLLHFQKQLDAVGGALGGAAGGAGGGGISGIIAGLIGGKGAAGPSSPSTTGAAPAASLGIRLWELIPIDSNLFGMLLQGGTANDFAAAQGADRDRAKNPKDDAARALEDANSKRPQGAPRLDKALHSFGAFDGSYSAKTVDENSRINVIGLDGLGGQPMAALTELRAMMAPPKYDFIFDEDDANRDRVQRDDVIIAMKDWIDNDEVGTGIDPTNLRSPFVSAFSDENGSYDRYNPRYKSKNGRFDSLEELYMVRGVNDRFMAAFGDRLTIWPDINSKLNINTSDPQQMTTNILIAARNPNDSRLQDPLLIKTILQEIQLRKMFSFFGLSSADFVGVLIANGVQVRPELQQANSPLNFLGDTSDTFRITATGRWGRVESRITAVVRYDDLLGKLLYWKEE
jgi:general secretion pathway protein K